MATKMDPSCTVGFYCRNLAEFHELREKAEKVLAPPLQKGVYPFFTFIDQHADDTFTDSLEQRLNSLSGYGATMSISDPNSSLKRHSSPRRWGNGSGRDIDDDFVIQDDDDFVIVEVKRRGDGTSHKGETEDFVAEALSQEEFEMEKPEEEVKEGLKLTSKEVEEVSAENSVVEEVDNMLQEEEDDT